MLQDKRALFAKIQPIIGLALIVAYFAIRRPDFLSLDTVQQVLQLISVNLCLSLGMTLVILTGGIDLSVGSVLALTGAVTAMLLRDGITLPSANIHLQFTVTGAVTGGILAGALLGMLNGIAITKFRVPAFIATLGMLSVARGLTGIWTNHAPISRLGDNFSSIAFKTFFHFTYGESGRFGFPLQIFIAGGLACLCILLTRRMRFGRYIYAVGGNERAALLSGLPVQRTKLLVYTISGMTAAIGGVILTSRLGSAMPSAGVGYELDSIAAVVIGGTSLSGGRGSITGTLLGCLMIGVLSYGFDFLGTDFDRQLVFKGLIIVVAAGLDQWMAHRRT